MGIIKAADILLPTVADMGKWSVIACDQFTSDRGYWEETRRIVGDAPSTLHMILPEALMGSAEAEQARESISGYIASEYEGTDPDDAEQIRRHIAMLDRYWEKY